MASYLLALLFMQPACICVFKNINRILPMRHPDLYCSLSVITMDLLWILNQWFLPEPSMTINALILLAGFFYLPLFAVKGQKFLSLFALSILVCLSLIIINLVGLSLLFFAPYLHMDGNCFLCIENPLNLLRILICDLIIVPSIYFLSRAMARYRDTVYETKGLLWILSIPLSQAAVLNMLNDNLSYAGNSRGLYLILFAALLCIAADCASILSYRKLLELKLIADQVQSAEQQLNVQSEYYREMQENIIRVNRIRHDLNNQLKTAYYLLEQGHPEEVRRQLDTLQSCVQEHIGTSYCENFLVDAILKEKSAHCQKLGIPLELHVLVPADLKIESAHLCSAFSNLLDNCIAAAKNAGPDSGPIILRSDIHKGYLTILCSNPSVPPQKQPRQDILRRHGMGLEILGRLAKLYDGNFQTSYTDGRFHVTMMLKNT